MEAYHFVVVRFHTQFAVKRNLVQFSYPEKHFLIELDLDVYLAQAHMELHYMENSPRQYHIFLAMMICYICCVRVQLAQSLPDFAAD